MQVGKLFDFLTDTKDVLEFFDGVDNRDQLVSRLERLKRQGTDDFYACVEGLRASLTAFLSDTLEMSAAPSEGESDDSDPEVGSDGEASLDEESDLDRQLEEIGKAWLDGETKLARPEEPLVQVEDEIAPNASDDVPTGEPSNDLPSK